MAELDLQHYQNRHSLKSKIARVLWNLVWNLIFRWQPTGFRLSWMVRRSLLNVFGATIATDASVHGSARIWYPQNLEMGRRAVISDRVDVYSVDKITIGNQTVISQDVFLCTASHHISSPIMELKTKPIVIGNNCWVCARSIILPGVVIGEGAVVAAGAVVAHDVEPWTIVGGNPAKLIGTREIKGA